MTTQKQAIANRSNALKSTGAKSPQGKALVAGNAIKHGILSSRILLDGEDADIFGQLRDEMVMALRPVGILERALAEKITVALWKQRRLVEAETATIELARSTKLASNRKAIKTAMGMDYAARDVSGIELASITKDELGDNARDKQIIIEFAELDQEVLDTNNLSRLAEEAPQMFAMFKDEAETDAGEGFEIMTPEEYLVVCVQGKGLAEWAYATVDTCKSEIKHHERRMLAQEIAKLVAAKEAVPIANELLMRYQVAIDSELYRAMDQFRRQQEWRMKSAIEIEAEVVG